MTLKLNNYMPFIKDPTNSSRRPFISANLLVIAAVLILVAGNIFLAFKYSQAKNDLRVARREVATQKINDQVLEFAQLFIDKVLKAQTEVDFETRLKLENAVRKLGDEEILNHWQSFVASQTELEAQAEVKELLATLVNKIRVN